MLRMLEKTTIYDLIKTLIGCSITVGIVWLISQIESIKLLIRLIVFFVFWVVCVWASLFYDADWKNFSFKYGTFELIVRIFAVIVWTVIIYFAAFHGIGLQEHPFEDV